MVSLKVFQRGRHGVSRLVVEDGILKVIKEAASATPEGQILAREAEALHQLAGWAGVPRLLEWSAGRLVRSFVAGRTLGSLLLEGSPVRPQLACWMEELAELLRHIHGHGLWHGDVSPDNLLITPEDRLVLLDWGGPQWGTPPYSLAGGHGPEADWHGWRTLCQEFFAAASPPPGRPGPRLLGRQESLARLRQAWDRAAFSESTWVGVSAPSGGGKTALLREMLWWAPHHGWGMGSTLTTPVTYRLFQSLLDSAHWCLDSSALEESSWRQLLATFPALDPDHPQEITPSALSAILIAEGWTELLRLQCQKCPLLLIFDDVQWADESSLKMLQLLSRRPIAGLMVVLAWRSDDFVLPEGIRVNFEVPLPPLTPEDVKRWSWREEVAIEADQAQQLTDWTRGNPLLIAEWLRQPQRPEFSDRVGWLLRDRVRGLPPEVLRVLQLAALMGRQFDVAPLQMAGPGAEAAVAWAQQQQLLLPGPRFSHDKVREALLEDLSESERQNWHARLGEYYASQRAAPQRCAFHFWLAGQGREAYPHALQAARLEKQQAALASAAYYFAICSQVQATPPTLLEHAQVLRLLGRNREALEWLERGTRLPEAGPLLADLHLLAGQVARNQGDMAQAFQHAESALKELVRLPVRRARELSSPVLSLCVEVCYEEVGLAAFLRLIAPRISWLVRHCAGDSVLRANLTIILSQILPAQPMRYIRRTGLQAARREPDLLTRTRAIQRYMVCKFGEGDGHFHERILHSLAPHLEDCGVPWELSMLYFQVGLYAAARGDFAGLREVAAKIFELGDLGGDESIGEAAVYFETVASGARLSWQRLSRTTVGPKSNWFLYRALAQALYLLRDGRPDQAYATLKQLPTYPNPLERAKYQAWLATTARTLAENTPRRWRSKRARLFEEAVQAAARALKVGPWGKLSSFRAKREMALALVGLGRAPEALSWLEQSAAEARAFGASYEYALTLQAWGSLGQQLGWADWDQKQAEGVSLLQSLGAWWDLAADSPGLPLQEVGEVAQRFLISSDQASRTRLTRWTGSAWVAHVEEARQRNQSLRADLLAANRLLQGQLNRWKSFLLNGPVAVGRFDADGKCLEGTVDLTGRPARVELEGGQYALLCLPVRRSEFALCTGLIDAEMADLNQQLARHLADAQKIPQGPLSDLLVKQCQDLMQWHLAGQAPCLPGAWFARNLRVRQVGEVPWDRLGPQSRSALVNILREAISNAERHSSGGEVCVTYLEGARELEVRVRGDSSQASPRSSSGQRSFGMQSMRFRASLAGGSLSWQKDFELCLKVPLSNLSG